MALLGPQGLGPQPLPFQIIRGGSCAPSSHTSSSSDGGDDNPSIDSGDDNSAEAVATRRAFMTSLSSTRLAPSASRSEVWSQQQILEWVGPAVAMASSMEDRASGAKAFWFQWSKVEEHIPYDSRQQMVKFMDEKLRSSGFPCLKDLITVTTSC